MNWLKNISTICFSIVILFSSMGVCLNQVFCSDQKEFHYVFSLASLEKICTCTDHEASETSTCCKSEKTENRKKCCSNKFVKVEISDDYEVNNRLFDFNQQKDFIITPFATINLNHQEKVINLTELIIPPPPDITQNKIVLIQSFLI